MSVLLDGFVIQRVTRGAFDLAMGSWSGRTLPDHDFGTLAGVSHARYSQIVRSQIVLFMQANNTTPARPLTMAQMDTFIGLIENGLNADGSPNNELRAFNNEVRARRLARVRQEPRAAAVQPESVNARRARGSWYSTNSGRVLGVAAIPIGWFIADSVGMLNVAANGQPGQQNYFRDAVEALAQGNLAAAERALFGGSNENRFGGFFGQLVAAGHGRAALRFQADWDARMAALRASVRGIPR